MRTLVILDTDDIITQRLWSVAPARSSGGLLRNCDSLGRMMSIRTTLLVRDSFSTFRKASRMDASEVAGAIILP